MSEFKKGDRVYNLKGGWGEVTTIIDNKGHAFMVDFDNGGRMPITKDGKFTLGSDSPSVFHTSKECLDYMAKDRHN